ncbi:MAG TPA: hypothetical protein VJY15_25705 [Candidatus Acidoferrum sp.]|nr:hypothetical protein [Candidatus Acidoferrum sp.]
MIFDGEIAGGPATSPTLYLSSGQSDRLGRFIVSQGGLLMKQQHKPKALDGLDRHSSAGHGVHGSEQEFRSNFEQEDGATQGVRTMSGKIGA